MNQLKNNQKQKRDTKTVHKPSIMKKEFHKSLTNAYKNYFLSDVTLRIIEDTADETDKKLNDGKSNDNKVERRNNEVCFPVNSLVLCLNSKVFEKLLRRTCIKRKYEKEITLNVNPGDSEYVELLIHSFYDFDLLNDIGLLKLLNLLEIGNRYMCDALLKQGSSMVEYVTVATIDECNSVLDRIAFYERSLSHVLTKAFFGSCCSQYLMKSFTPLECVVFGELPNKLNFSSLLMLLKSNDGFAFNENSVMTFVLNWLEADESRQTEQNIEALLAECRYEHMEVQFLKTVLSHTNPILCKWSGFLSWYIKAVTYPSSIKRNNQSYMRLNRSLKTEYVVPPGYFGMVGICRVKDNEKDVYHEYNLKMEFNEDKKKWISDKWIMYKGYILQPVITLRGNENMVILEMYLGKEYQEMELEGFNLKISFQIGFSAENQKNANWFGFVMQHTMEFLECNRAETSINLISQEIFQNSCYVCHLFF